MTRLLQDETQTHDSKGLSRGTLTLPLKGVYFDEIRAGTKTEEYRLCTPYWGKRLLERSYGSIVLTKGYPARDDHARRLVLPWRGYTIKVIEHPHFGDKPVSVFAIIVGHQQDSSIHAGSGVTQADSTTSSVPPEPPPTEDQLAAQDSMWGVLPTSAVHPEGGM